MPSGVFQVHAYLVLVRVTAGLGLYGEDSVGNDSDIYVYIMGLLMPPLN